LAKLAPEPAPTPAEADQAVPLVQVIESPPVPSTFDPEMVSTLPKARAEVETVQLAVTVAVTLIDELAVPATAAPGKARAAAKAVAQVAIALERGLVNISASQSL
jgi:hypothetical protein